MKPCKGCEHLHIREDSLISPVGLAECKKYDLVIHFLHTNERKFETLNCIEEEEWFATRNEPPKITIYKKGKHDPPR